jgi:hypothetical protein
MEAKPIKIDQIKALSVPSEPLATRCRRKMVREIHHDIRFDVEGVNH